MLAEIDNFTAEEYQQYIESLGNMGDYQNIINTAVEEAELRGRAMGREEGVNMARKEDARRFKELGVDLAIIAQATGLTVEEIEKL